MITFAPFSGLAAWPSRLPFDSHSATHYMCPMASSKTSGLHTSPRRILSGAAAEFRQWDAAAAAKGLTWADWARAALNAAYREQCAADGRPLFPRGRTPLR